MLKAADHQVGQGFPAPSVHRLRSRTPYHLKTPPSARSIKGRYRRTEVPRPGREHTDIRQLFVQQTQPLSHVVQTDMFPIAPPGWPSACAAAPSVPEGSPGHCPARSDTKPFSGTGVTRMRTQPALLLGPMPCLECILHDRLEG